MKVLIFLLVLIAAVSNFAILAEAQGQRCWRTPSGWVCQQQQQTNPSNGQ
jgi:hypothetical protein